MNPRDDRHAIAVGVMALTRVHDAIADDRWADLIVLGGLDKAREECSLLDAYAKWSPSITGPLRGVLEELVDAIDDLCAVAQSYSEAWDAEDRHGAELRGSMDHALDTIQDGEDALGGWEQLEAFHAEACGGAA